MIPFQEVSLSLESIPQKFCLLSPTGRGGGNLLQRIPKCGTAVCSNPSAGRSSRFCSRIPEILGWPERSCLGDPVFPLVTATTAMQTEWKRLWGCPKPEERRAGQRSRAGPKGLNPLFVVTQQRHLRWEQAVAQSSSDH